VRRDAIDKGCDQGVADDRLGVGYDGAASQAARDAQVAAMPGRDVVVLRP